MKVPIKKLIDIVSKGGAVKTGIDVYTDQGVLLLEKNTLIKDIKLLKRIVEEGFTEVPFNPHAGAGIWDKAGNPVTLPQPKTDTEQKAPAPHLESIQQKVAEITEVRKGASEKHALAKTCLKKVIKEIRQTGGEFDLREVENTVSEILEFLTENENSFSYLTHEIFSYDDYLYNHSINVCTIATATLQKFNRFVGQKDSKMPNLPPLLEATNLPYTKSEVKNISTGFFLHDVGKVLLPGAILNKKGPLTPDERTLVNGHSYEKGLIILHKNKITDPTVIHTVRSHHCAIYENESDCYPDTPDSNYIPVYVKICKLADIYDAMTAKRCYKEAFNPVAVVYWIFKDYAGKDDLLQFILHSFVNTVGIYPAGSVVSLRNGQKVYVIDSKGPIVLPFTDKSGSPLDHPADPVDLSEKVTSDEMQAVDRKAELLSPKEAYADLPGYLKDMMKVV